MRRVDAEKFAQQTGSAEAGGAEGSLQASLLGCMKRCDRQAGSAEAGDAEGLLRRPHCAVAGRDLTTRQGAPRPGTRRVYSGGLTARLQGNI